MTAPIRIGIVGVGKIAQDQHIPVLDASPAFDLVAGASRHGRIDGRAGHATLEAMLAAETLDAVSLCQPPQVRFEAAVTAIRAGKHVFLEKPPGATLSEVETLVELARHHDVTLFASWHSRYASGVGPARVWLTDKTIRRVFIEWKEDVRHWHPGQTWIWQAGGMGVFDPGINALSIATAILPPFHLTGGTLDVPENCQSPIAAALEFVTVDGAPVAAALDFLQTGPQTWDITVETDAGTLVLSKGGSEMSVDGAAVALPAEAEYRGLYDRFAELIAAGKSDVDLAPLRHVADAFLRAERRTVEPFIE